MMYMVKGAVSIFYIKQKISVRISIEDDMIGVDSAMAKIIWSRHSIETQGYKTTHNKLIQDNRSAIILEKRSLFR